LEFRNFRVLILDARRRGGTRRKQLAQRSTHILEFMTQNTKPSHQLNIERPITTTHTISIMMKEDDTLYQVNFLIENVGKRKAQSKKRITWTFAKGDHEYTVTFLWSKRSGKQFVYMSDNEVFFGRKKGASVFFHKWTTRDGSMNLHILATAATPSKKHVAPGFRKYELIVNGQPFYSMPRKDGTTPPTAAEGEGEGEGNPRGLPTSILDIIYPNGYHDANGTKGEGAYNSHAKLHHEVRRRIAAQSTYNAHHQSSAN
jgi:hypothetical protein